ncbi:MAG: DUF2818 family protein [Burkholderiaceae bacterium]
MRTDLAALLFVIFGFVAASLPFFFSRWALVLARPSAKPFILYAVESFVLFAFVVGGFAVWEARSGQRSPQDWEYYAVMVCLWLVAAFPGFVWRFLLQKKSTVVARDADEEAD